jgi:hypothetical protein
MAYFRSGTGQESGFAVRRPQSRFWLERASSAAMSVTINVLVLVGLGWGLTESRRWAAKPDRSTAITVVTLVDPRRAKQEEPTKDRPASKRRAMPTIPTHPRFSSPSVQTPPSLPIPSAMSALPAASPPTITRPIVPASPPTLEFPVADAASVLDAYRQQLWAIIAAHRPPGVHLDGEVGIRFVLEKILTANAVRETGMVVRKRNPLRAAMAFIHQDYPAAIAGEIDGGGQSRRTAADNQSVIAILRHTVRGFLLDRPGRLASEPNGSTLDCTARWITGRVSWHSAFGFRAVLEMDDVMSNHGPFPKSAAAFKLRYSTA